MRPPTDAVGPRPLRGVEPVAPVHSASDPQREVFNRFTQIGLGKLLQAEVVSRLDDGTHLVKIDHATFKAALPGDPDVGEFLALKFVAAEPRLTFLLMPRAGTDTASLSTAAKLIGDILQATSKDAGTATISGKAPILPAGSGDTGMIASALKNALAVSGLFYESHLRQWADGKRPLADLQQEMQSRPGMSGMQHAAMPPRTSLDQAAHLVAIVSDWDNAAPTVHAAGTGAAPAERLSSEAMQTVSLQLQMLEQGKILWHGELWPGQPLEWEVSEDKPQEQGDAGDMPSWSSTVRFSLPTLGVVSAHIRLDSNRVQMQLRTAAAETAELLQQHGADLAGALDAAGSPLDAFSVKQDEQA